MKIAFWSYVIGQVALVLASLFGKISIWVSLIPTFALVAISAGMAALMLLIGFILDYDVDDNDLLDWDDIYDENKDCGVA